VSSAVVVVGGGLAGWRTAAELRRLGHEGPITVLAEESEPPYDRPPLSKRVLTGVDDPSVAHLTSPALAADLDIDLRLGARVTRLSDDRARTVDGDEVGWDALVLAMGAKPVRPSWVPDHPRVHYLRTMGDSLRLREALGANRSLVVVGGGFIGCEVAAAARELGLVVTVLESQPELALGALGAPVAGLLSQLHRSRGEQVVLGDPVAGMEVTDAGGVTVLLSSGAVVTADIAVVGLGVRPEAGLLGDCTPDPAAGVLCDERGRVVGRSSVWAVGDVARWRSADGAEVRREHWSSAVDQATVVAHDVLGLPMPAHLLGPPYVWSDQHGLKVQVLGRPDLADSEAWLVQEGGGGAYGYMRGARLVGVVTLGSPRLLAKHRARVTEELAALLVEPARFEVEA
jgi:NADPH-dependent 2,4-dienoyl-CoA reductase/sulfur reductase-like enzyme